MDIDKLNNEFAISEKLKFSNVAPGLITIDIDTPIAIASISLMGGQVLTWHPKSQVEPILWLSKDAYFDSKNAIRGGVPICWPWFGPHPSNSQLQGHGFARITPWDVISTSVDSNEVIDVKLKLANSFISTASIPDWPLKVELSSHIRIGENLEISLTTINNSQQCIKLTEGLHTYFNIGDIEDVKILGLDNYEYIDLINDNERRHQFGPIEFNNELGRIYVNCTMPVEIKDYRFSRVIRVEGIGSNSIAVWNPWLDTASKMSDLGRIGWRSMVCVENANALENEISLLPQGHHSLRVIYSATELDL